MTEAEQNYGKKIDYDPLWKGPMEKIRTRTDLPFLLSFGIFLVLWMGIAIYAYSNGNIQSLFDGLNNNDGVNDIAKWSGPIFSAKTAIGFIVLSGFISVSYIILLRWFSKIIVYTAIFIICTLLFGTICVTSYLYATKAQGEGFLALLIVYIIVFLFTVIFFLVLRKKINIACEVITESSKALTFFPSSLVFPMLPYLLYVIVTVYGGSVFFCLISITNPNNEVPGYIYFFHFINIFGILWLIGFVTAFAQMILSGSFATWYWTSNKSYIPSYTIIRFMDTTSRYHLGTIAFGSLIVAICQMINILLSFIRRRLQGSCNPLACLLFGWYKFLFGNLEICLKFINRNAYIMCAIHGTRFIQSAKDAFNLLMRNIINVLVINNVTNAILFLGQLLAVGLSVLATWGYCHNAGLDNIVPTAVGIVTVFSILLSVSFFTVLRTAIDTVILCVLEDSERNDGSEEKPYYMSFKLKALFLQEAKEIQ